MRKRRAFTIKSTPNPTSLTMAERHLCMNMMHSLEDSVDHRLREKYGTVERASHQDIEQTRAEVQASAYRQLTGRQPGTGGPFTLTITPEALDADEAYVRKSLGLV